MSKIQVTTKTSEQITAAFAKVFSKIQPTGAQKPLTQADRFAPYKKEILKQRRRGLSWKQIAKGMADPEIGERVSNKMLRQLFGEAPATPKPAPASAPKEYLYVDPLTGKATITAK